MSYTLEYSESEDCWSVETHSAAPSDGLYMKRCQDLLFFKEQWEKQQAERDGAK
jgi:hypothetical protein